MGKYIFSLLILILFVSCSPKTPYKVVKHFPTPVKIDGKRVFKNEYRIASLRIVDSLAVLSLNRDTLLSVYNKNNANFIGRFGRKGKGPGEFQRFFLLKNIIEKNGKYLALVNDQIKKEPRIIDLSSSLKQMKLKIYKNIELPDSLRRTFITDIFFASDNKYVGMYDDRIFKKLTGNRGGFILDKSTDEFKTFSLLNLKTEPNNPSAELNLNTRIVKTSPNGKKIVFALMHTPLVEVFDIRSLSERKFLINSNSLQTTFNLADFNNDKVPQYLIDIVSTGNSIYVLTSEENSEICKSCQEILEMGWDGKPKAVYKFSDAYKLDWFTIDTSSKAFWGVSWSDDKAYKFNF